MKVTHVGLWYDEVEAWVVSLDGISRNEREVTTVKHRFRGDGDDATVFAKARARAIELAQEKSLPLFMTQENGMLQEIATS